MKEPAALRGWLLNGFRVQGVPRDNLSFSQIEPIPERGVRPAPRASARPHGRYLQLREPSVRLHGALCAPESVGARFHSGMRHRGGRLFSRHAVRRQEPRRHVVAGNQRGDGGLDRFCGSVFT